MTFKASVEKLPSNDFSADLLYSSKYCSNSHNSANAFEQKHEKKLAKYTIESDFHFRFTTSASLISLANVTDPTAENAFAISPYHKSIFPALILLRKINLNYS